MTYTCLKLYLTVSNPVLRKFLLDQEWQILRQRLCENQKGAA